jgi:hypothetical protein
MKPREPLPQTDVDASVWAYLCLRNTGVMGRQVAGLFLFYQAADRRDANLIDRMSKVGISPYCLGCVAGPMTCRTGVPSHCRLRVVGNFRDQVQGWYA